MATELNAVRRTLQLGEDVLSDTEPRWEASCRTLPGRGPNFLKTQNILELSHYCRLPQSVKNPLVATATYIAASPHLCPLIWHLHRELCDQADSPTGGWPDIEPLGDDRGLFYLLLALAMVPPIREVHTRMSIDATITRDTCRQIKCFLDNHRTGCEGRPGIFVTELAWLRHYLAGHLFRLGRLEYMLQPPPSGERIFRHRRHGTVVMLLPPETPLDHEGYVLPPESDEALASTTYEENDHEHVGFPAAPSGVAERTPISLNRRDWELACRPNDPVIDMHIPSGGGLTPEATIDSFQRAFKFFSDQVPARPPRIIRCVSWIFNPQLVTDLPGSNFAHVLPELYLFPVASPPDSGLNFVFRRNYDDWSMAPRSTRLQRLMLSWRLHGRGLRHGGMLFLDRELAAWGTQPYRHRHGPRAARMP